MLKADRELAPEAQVRFLFRDPLPSEIASFEDSTGFQTYGEAVILNPGDGDPVDVLVITPVPLNSGVVVRCRPLCVLKMEDESGFDAKVLAVPVDKLSTLYRGLKDYSELPEIILKQIEHFFAHYKDLEPNKWVKIGGWEGIEEARKEIMEGVDNYNNAKVKPEF